MIYLYFILELYNKISYFIGTNRLNSTTFVDVLVENFVVETIILKKFSEEEVNSLSKICVI